MLILTRRLGEKITIGDDVTITVTEIRKDGLVRLGIDAPPEVPVHRLEVQRLVDEARRRAREGPRP